MGILSKSTYGGYKNPKKKKSKGKERSEKRKKKGVPTKGELMNQNRSGAYFNKVMDRNIGVLPISAGTGRMLIGKHKGKQVSEVPLEELNWMLDSLDLSVTGKALVKMEIEKRK
jgi:hypothetical protein